MWNKGRLDPAGLAPLSPFPYISGLLPNGHPVARGAQVKSVGDQILAQGAHAGA